MATALEYLRDHQNPDGGWGYISGQESVVEPTSAALLALNANIPGHTAITRAIDWLRQGQHPDGGWGLTPRDPESTWQTAWAILALAKAGGADGAIPKGANWLLTEPVLSLEDDEMQAQFRASSGADINLRGWPWLPGEVTWVEPTALAMLALLEIPTSPQILARLDEAARCLQDRRCVGGGWNVGAPIMLGAALPARAVPTAWSVLALARFAPQALLPEDRRVLRSESMSDGGNQALAWGMLALTGLGEAADEFVEPLVSRQQTNGSWNDHIYHTALADLALGGGW
jgi:hypothetical protein